MTSSNYDLLLTIRTVYLGGFLRQMLLRGHIIDCHKILIRHFRPHFISGSMLPSKQDRMWYHCMVTPGRYTLEGCSTWLCPFSGSWHRVNNLSPLQLLVELLLVTLFLLHTGFHGLSLTILWATPSWRVNSTSTQLQLTKRQNFG